MKDGRKIIKFEGSLHYYVPLLAYMIVLNRKSVFKAEGSPLGFLTLCDFHGKIFISQMVLASLIFSLPIRNMGGNNKLFNHSTSSNKREVLQLFQPKVCSSDHNKQNPYKMCTSVEVSQYRVEFSPPTCHIL